MDMKIGTQEFRDLKCLIAGFMTEGEAEEKFNMVATPGIPFNIVMQLLHSMTLQMLYAFVEQHPEAREDIYDAYNMMASTILTYIIPDKELRPDLTEEAIMEAERKLIEERYEAMSDEDKAKADEKIESIKQRIAEMHETNSKKV